MIEVISDNFQLLLRAFSHPPVYIGAIIALLVFIGGILLLAQVDERGSSAVATTSIGVVAFYLFTFLTNSILQKAIIFPAVILGNVIQDISTWSDLTVIGSMSGLLFGFSCFMWSHNKRMAFLILWYSLCIFGLLLYRRYPIIPYEVFDYTNPWIYAIPTTLMGIMLFASLKLNDD